jgi:hypothetical protein
MNPTAVRIMITCDIEDTQYCMAYIDSCTGKFILPGGKLLEYGEEIVETKEDAILRYMNAYFGHNYANYIYEWGKFIIDSTFCVIINGNAILDNGLPLWKSIMEDNRGIEIRHPFIPYPLYTNFDMTPSGMTEYHYPGLYAQSTVLISDAIRAIILQSYKITLTKYAVFEQRYVYLGNILSRILEQLKRSLK